MPVCRKSVRAFTRVVYVRRDPLQPVAGEQLGESLSRVSCYSWFLSLELNWRDSWGWLSSSETARLALGVDARMTGARRIRSTLNGRPRRLYA